MELDCAIDSVYCSCPLLLWSGPITMIFLYRVIQKSVYLTNPCDNDPVIGGRPSVIMTNELLPPLATVYLPRQVSPGTRHASVDFYWIIPRTHPPGDFTMHPDQKGPARKSRVAWRGVVSSAIVILYADIASTERERKRDSQDLVPLSGLILNGSGCLLVVNLHATRPLRCVFFDLGLQPASHTRTLSR
ncbi:hypothetical protein BDV30DRAFT_190098 [Aspergillus minisclerotigenes]|uniref:Uncharacterized protein n=1 Tax=Aspergillus minisclerotigenes TaxID=656917 RepID=A0A5N6ITS8_9EURO|nr:hypothetical protein BDV30DRAFT_190098 [Aspergillus minisclerotigenes]